MPGPQTGHLRFGYDPSGLPAFLMPVFEQGEAPYFTQDAKDGTIQGFSQTGFDAEDEKDLRPLPVELQRKLNVGEPVVYVFGLTKARFLVGTARELAPLLEAELPSLSEYPNLCDEVRSFVANAKK